MEVPLSNFLANYIFVTHEWITLLHHSPYTQAGGDEASVAGTGVGDGVTSIVALEEEAAANENGGGGEQQDQEGTKCRVHRWYMYVMGILCVKHV